MPADDETCDDSRRMSVPRSRPQAGIVVVLAAGRPAALAFEAGPAGIEVGRGTPAGALDDDERISRRHVRVAPREGRVPGWVVEDLGSRNGTFVDGRRIGPGQASFERNVVVRIGRSLLWAVDDVRRSSAIRCPPRLRAARSSGAFFAAPSARSLSRAVRATRS
ncbi:MAG TPA: FHA domain-containing protein [Polyangiaceae bacterium]|jgi:hypothetical protein